MDSEFVTSRGTYTITRERSKYWSKYIVWSADGEVLDKVSSFEEAKRLMDEYIHIDVMSGDLDYT